MKHDLYMLNGGLLYLGIIVSLILVLGTGLMLYYKQLSEGLSDQKNFQIMKRVGLEDSLIKQTIRAQILWIFVLPLTIAILHTLAASRLVFGILLGMIQMVDRSVIISSVGGVIIAFSLCYICYYWLTSRVYYRLVSTDDMHD